MTTVTRRSLLTGAAAAGGLAALGPGAAPAAGAAAAGTPLFGPATVPPEDPRYADLVRGGNQRFVGTPDYVSLVGSTAQVVGAVQRAVNTGRKVAVRSGGHCYESFVTDPSVRVVIDLAELDQVYFDAARSAFVVEAGATLGDVYKKLYKGWGVTVPAGNCPTVGAGGHIVGGGYGVLSRLFGLVVDHLYAIEVVYVDADGTARSVVATREDDDPNRELWWAHTGGGGGNFGIVTRFWLRSDRVAGAAPGELLPQPPRALLVSAAQWSWNDLDESSFARIVHNYARWHVAHSEPGAVYTGLAGQLKLFHRAAGTVGLATQIDATLPNAEQLLTDFYTGLTSGVRAPLVTTEQRALPWWHASMWNGFNGGDSPLTLRFKAKSSYQRADYTDAQVSGLYQGLTDPGYTNPATVVLLAGYGGAVNAVPPTATATYSRDSVIKMEYLNFWTDPVQDADNVNWMRRFYRGVFADTGGVPVPNQATDGTFINYADADMADPAWNTSDVGWETLYYGGNYPRLQQIKSRWDPHNVFNHALSIQLPG